MNVGGHEAYVSVCDYGCGDVCIVECRNMYVCTMETCVCIDLCICVLVEAAYMCPGEA